MTDTAAIFRGLKDAYLRYFDSPFDLRFDELVNERRDLLDRDGVLYRDPLIEPQPPYAGSRQNVVQAARPLKPSTGLSAMDPEMRLPSSSISRYRNGRSLAARSIRDWFKASRPARS